MGSAMSSPRPFLSVLDELRTIELGEDEVVMQFDNTGDHVERIVHMTAAHPANVQPSLHGHSIGRWEGETLVIDTIGFEPNPSGLGHERAVEPAQAHGRAADAHGGSHAPALRGHRRRPGRISRGRPR